MNYVTVIKYLSILFLLSQSLKILQCVHIRMHEVFGLNFSEGNVEANEEEARKFTMKISIVSVRSVKEKRLRRKIRGKSPPYI